MDCDNLGLGSFEAAMHDFVEKALRNVKKPVSKEAADTWLLSEIKRVVTCGDCPCIKVAKIRRLFSHHDTMFLVLETSDVSPKLPAENEEESNISTDCVNPIYMTCSGGIAERDKKINKRGIVKRVRGRCKDGKASQRGVALQLRIRKPPDNESDSESE